MSNSILECINEYIESHHQGGLIGISTLVDFCKQPMWKIYSAIQTLESQGKVKIVTRYFCPESHFIPNHNVPFCPACDLRYSEVDIVTIVYINPIVNQQLIIPNR